MPSGAAENSGQNRLCLIVFSGEMEKMLAAFVLATGAAASGMSVGMFFTFWATAALNKGGFQVKRKPMICDWPPNEPAPPKATFWPA
jgi:peroxiredoxin family protein